MGKEINIARCLLHPIGLPSNIFRRPGRFSHMHDVSSESKAQPEDKGVYFYLNQEQPGRRM